MNLDKMYRNILIKEFESIFDDCNKSKQNIDDFLYFYSAAYGVVRRVMNFQCEPTLVLAHLVLENSFQVINQRWTQSTKPNTTFKTFPTELPVQIITEFGKLLDAIKENDDNSIRVSLESIANISYISTGNGYYLFLKDKLKLPEIAE